MARFSTYRQKDYDGGLNTSSSRRDIEQNQASVLKNWDIHVKSRLISRKGITQVGDTQSNTIYTSGVYRRANGSNHLLINEGTSIKYLNGSTFDSIGTTDTVSQAQDLSWQNVIVNDKIYLSSEDNGLNQWNGGAGGLAAVASSPAGNKILWYQNHLFHLNNVNVSGTKYKNRLYWSNFGDPETYTTASDFINSPGEGRLITADVIGNAMAIFKDDSFMFLTGYGSSSWAITASSTSIQNYDSSVGCLAVRGTVKISPSELWFMDNQGRVRRITQTDYGFTTKVMSNNIDPSDLNLSNIDKTIAWFDDNKVYFAVCSTGSSVRDLVLVFDYTTHLRTGKEAWTTYTGWEVNDLVTFGSQPILYVVGNTSKKVYSHSGGSDDGSLISCRWDGKNDDYGFPERYKKYAYGYTYSQSQNDEQISIHASVDGASFANIDTFSLNSTGTQLGPTGTATMGPTGLFILGGNEDIEEKYYFADGGGAITGKSLIMSVRASVDQQVFTDTFTNHFVLRSLR